MSEAQRIFEDFNARSVDGDSELDVQFPSRWCVVGQVKHIVYRSDKWDDGIHDYIHHYETPVSLYAGEHDPVFFGAAHKPGPAVKPPLPPIVGGKRQCASLGDCIELKFLRTGARKAELVELDRGSLGSSPPLAGYRSRGRDGLLIIIDGHPVVLYGGEQEIRPEGITG